MGLIVLLEGSALLRFHISASAARLVEMYRCGTNGRKMSSAEMYTKGDASVLAPDREAWNVSYSVRAVGVVQSANHVSVARRKKPPPTRVSIDPLVRPIGLSRQGVTPRACSIFCDCFQDRKGPSLAMHLVVGFEENPQSRDERIAGRQICFVCPGVEDGSPLPFHLGRKREECGGQQRPTRVRDSRGSGAPLRPTQAYVLPESQRGSHSG